MSKTCSWAAPGANPYKGTVAQALDRYGFTAHEKAVILGKHKRVDFDEVVMIRKDGITSPYGESWALWDMHFGNGYCQGEVDRSAWKDGHEEMALVYCALDRCIAVPRICGNVSRTYWRPMQKNEVEIRPEHDALPAHTVPEPGTLGLVLIAIALVAYLKGRKNGG